MKELIERRVELCDHIANLLRDRLASKLDAFELYTLINDVTSVYNQYNQYNHQFNNQDDRIDKLKHVLDYIEYKSQSIERALRASHRHTIRERRDFFRERSPL